QEAKAPSQFRDLFPSVTATSGTQSLSLLSLCVI
ncbi:unnamed protein product, partial [Brassica oleracea]